MDVEDLATTFEVGEREVELAVKATRTTEGGVDGVGSVGGADDDDLACEGGQRSQLPQTWSDEK